MPARLTPKWRVIVRILKWGAIGTSFTEFNTEGEHRSRIARHAIEACGRFRGAVPLTASRDGA
jgi:hypothetical protein